MNGDEGAKLEIKNEEEVNRAITMLSMRVEKLETNAPALAVSASDGTDLRPMLAATLARLKELRTALVTTGSEFDGKAKELQTVKTENEKLKYQIKHLRRSLEAEESKNASKPLENSK